MEREEEMRCCDYALVDIFYWLAKYITYFSRIYHLTSAVSIKDSIDRDTKLRYGEFSLLVAIRMTKSSW